MVEIMLLAAVFCIAALLAALEIIRGVRAHKLASQHDAAMRRLQSDIHALCAGAINMSNHTAALEQKLRRMMERLDQVELRDPVQQTYAHAIRLAQQGADVDDLVEHCGLARGEADFLLRVHRVQRQRAVSA